MRRVVAPFLIIAALAGPAPAQSPNVPQGLSQDDRNFLDFAAQDNQAEIDLCLLAQRKATSPAVKAFARLMVHDHVAVESRLAVLADAERVSVANGIDKEAQERQSRLQALEGDAFDRAFMQAQIEDHAHDLDQFRAQAATTNPGVARFAAESVAMLVQHHELALMIAAALERGGGNPAR